MVYLPAANTGATPGASSGQTTVNQFGTAPAPVYSPGITPVQALTPAGAPARPTRQVAFGAPGAPPVSDPLARDIGTALGELQREVAPVAYADLGFRYRDGEVGLGRLFELDNTTSFTFSPANTGRLTVQANPVHVAAGKPDLGGAKRFGTNPLLAPARPLRPADQTDTGLGLSASYAIADVKVDVGTTPLGFQLESLQGGIQWQPALTDALRLRLTADRRAVTDSVLSYAGTRDPLSGKEWGGVMRTGGEIGLSYDVAEGGAYGSVGYHVYDGTNVADNAAWSADFGAYLRPYRTETSRLQVGVALSYLNFDKNLSQFTLGHGGYFSPQNYFAIAIPVDYRATVKKWTYNIGGAVGYQNFRQEAAPYFPNDPDLQASLQANAAANPGNDIPTAYAESSESGFGVSAQGGFEYALTPATTVGGSLSFSNFGDYSESSGKVFLRYQFVD
ncbi:hypothetical protein D3874_13645 [Oleomonas cavernae]|uniref:Cellulose synthase operon C C-terminal domain-containing protein n=1 Tax=Oleomonas cavernae TaxID=2320859 RepID=A0A418WD26_9PROT|nr:cellulose synthase subunit BcsC-related outer membrane protein [Oleomonas cavernae]RJF87935.1 hypothetical protein D3874_13645 [Oleomonas cavernae]